MVSRMIGDCRSVAIFFELPLHSASLTQLNYSRNTIRTQTAGLAVNLWRGRMSSPSIFGVVHLPGFRIIWPNRFESYIGGRRFEGGRFFCRPVEIRRSAKEEIELRRVARRPAEPSAVVRSRS